MALQVETKERTFTIKRGGKDITLPDPDPRLSPEEVKKHYMAVYPELTTAEISGPAIVGDKAEYKMDAKIGRKG